MSFELDFPLRYAYAYTEVDSGLLRALTPRTRHLHSNILMAWTKPDPTW